MTAAASRHYLRGADDYDADARLRALVDDPDLHVPQPARRIFRMVATDDAGRLMTLSLPENVMRQLQEIADEQARFAALPRWRRWLVQIKTLLSRTFHDS